MQPPRLPRHRGSGITGTTVHLRGLLDVPHRLSTAHIMARPYARM